MSKLIPEDFIIIPILLDEPNQDSSFYEILRKEENEINELKGLQSKWSAQGLTYKLLSATDLFKTLKYKLNKQNSSSQVPLEKVSNAWYKYYQIAKYFKLNELYPKPNIFFNAELPGTGILAFQDYYAESGMNWVASSLMPGDSTALGDRYGLYAGNPKQWLMSKEHNGDMTNLDEINYIANAAASYHSGKVDIAIHDAGMDIEEYFDFKDKTKDENMHLGFLYQEKINTALHIGCALCAFQCLSKGGTFIAKQYSFYEPINTSLIAIYTSLFANFYICKPSTSRPANSEIYLVGVGFKGITSNVRNLIIEALNIANVSKEKLIKADFHTIGDLSCHKSLLEVMDVIGEQQKTFLKEREKIMVQSNNSKKINSCISKLKKEADIVTDNWIKKYYS